jgi:hypothetical protein
MNMRFLIDDQIVHEGDLIPVPRPGDLIQRDGEELPVEAVVWDFEDGGRLIVGLRLGPRTYTY